MLNRTVANTIACSIVHTRLDYCNSLLYGATDKNIKRLQRVQNTLARVVTGTRRRDRIKPVLHELHWLPVAQRCEYKIALITHKVLSTGQPEYLRSLITEYQPTRHLRSEGKRLLAKPSGLSSAAASGSFTCSSEAIWNKLPEDLRKVQNLKTFKSRLKTFLFTCVDCM